MKIVNFRKESCNRGYTISSEMQSLERRSSVGVSGEMPEVELLQRQRSGF